MPRLPSGPLEKDLLSVRKHKLGVHGVDGMHLDVLGEVLIDAQVWQRTSGTHRSAALVTYLEAKIETLQLDDRLKRALRLDLAIEYPGDTVPDPTKRGQMAAAAADCSFDTYSHNRAGRGLGRRRIAVQKLVEALDPDGRYEQADQPKPRKATIADDGAALGNSRYFPLQEEDLTRGFWWRASTRDYVRQLSTQPSLTIFAGTDGVADVGPPLHGDLMLAMLRDCLNDEPMLKYLDEKSARETADWLTAQVRASGARAAYVGSVVRGLYATNRSRWTEAQIEGRLHNVIQQTTLGRPVGGYVATAITRLAFTLRHKGVGVCVVSAHYDSDLSESATALTERFPELGECFYNFLVNDLPVTRPAPHEIPLVSMHGMPLGPRAGRLMVGEVDMMSSDAPGRSLASSDTRVPVLEQLMSETSMLFVGSSLSDPALLLALARTRSAGPPRFALLASPITEEHPESVIADPPRALLLAVLASRYHYLGVTPIVVDFRYQIPQILTEAARRASEDADYVDYADRIDGWWRDSKDAFGFGRLGDEDPRRKAAQARWNERLRGLRDSMYKELSVAEREEVMIEVWLRNPDLDARYLFRWANSEGIWDRSKTAPVASLRAIGDITQKTFREGQTYWQETEHSVLGRWKYCVAMNLVLDRGPWTDLPVGVIKVLSTEARGKIHDIENSQAGSRFERLILETVRGLFDPASS